MNKNITHSRGRVVELSETVNSLQVQVHHLKKSIQRLVNEEDIAVNETKILLDEYALKSNLLSETSKAKYTIEDKWGLR